MTSIKLLYVHRFRDRHGHVRHYFRRRGFKRQALPGVPGSGEFMAVYQAALTGTVKLPIGVSRTKAGTISALAVAYYTSSEWKQLAPITQTTYRNIVEAFRAEHGDKPVVMLQREHVRRLIAAKADRPAAANALLKMLRILMRFAMDDGWRSDDPTHGIRRLKSRSEGWHPWSEEEIAQFEAHWSAGSRARLAMALLLYTGQRASDARRMGRQHVRNGVMDVRQHKTGTRLSIPLHPHLVAELGAVPADRLTFLVTESGKPFTAGGNWFGECARRAGLTGCTAHGLRKAAARRLAEAGCSAHEIMAVTGHQTLKEVAIYTKAADQIRLAIRAVNAIGGGKLNE